MQTGSSETLIGWKSGKTTMGPNGGSLQPGYGLSMVHNYMLASPSGHHFPQMDTAVPPTLLVN
jgi:hypothetical protein